MTTLSRLLRAEVRKLFVSRAFLASLAISVGLSVTAVAVDAAVAGKPGQPKLGSVAEVNQMFKMGAVTCVVMLVLGILAAGGEYRHRTIVATVLGSPRRSLVVAAKAAAVLIAGVVITTLTIGLGLATIVGVLSAHHIHHLPPNWFHDSLLVVAASTAFGLIGAALGFLARSTAGAVVIFGGWVIFGELIILNTVAPHIEKWLPVGLATSLTSPGDHPALASPVAVAALTGYVVVLLVVAAASVMTRDIS